MDVIDAASARTIAQLRLEYYEVPDFTETGVVCGDCSSHERRWDRPAPVRHASIAHIRYCFEVRQQMAEESKAELDAERATERFFEERGGGFQMDEDEYFRSRGYLYY